MGSSTFLPFTAVLTDAGTLIIAPSSTKSKGANRCPLQPAPKTRFTHIAAWSQGVLAVSYLGSLLYVDWNSGIVTDLSEKIAGKAADVVCGPNYAIVKTEIGDVFGWTLSQAPGQAHAAGLAGSGLPENFGSVSRPRLLVKVAALRRGKVIKMAAGADHALLLMESGDILGLGDVFGAAGKPSAPIVIPPPSGTSWTQVGAGDGHSIALASDGTAYAWGLGSVTKKAPELIASSIVRVRAGGASRALWNVDGGPVQCWNRFTGDGVLPEDTVDAMWSGNDACFIIREAAPEVVEAVGEEGDEESKPVSVTRVGGSPPEIHNSPGVSGYIWVPSLRAGPGFESDLATVNSLVTRLPEVNWAVVCCNDTMPVFRSDVKVIADGGTGSISSAWSMSQCGGRGLILTSERRVFLKLEGPLPYSDMADELNRIVAGMMHWQSTGEEIPAGWSEGEPGIAPVTHRAKHWFHHKYRVRRKRGSALLRLNSHEKTGSAPVA